MKITDVSITMFNWHSPQWQTGGGSFGGTRPLGVLTVHTDEGVEGHAFLGSSRQGADAHAGPLMEFIKPAIVGANPLDIGAIWQRMWKMNRSVSTNSIGAVDVALWDIAGKVAGLPIHRLLGTCRDRVPAYASSAWLPTPEAYGEEACHFKSLGWPAYKIHPHGIPKDDIKICQEVRRAVGDDMVLMLDSMWAYCYEDAVRVGRAIEALNYFWYEDPLVEEDLYNYVKLRDKMDIPIMSTEYAPGRLYGMAQWVQQMATDILRGDVAVTGGITPLVKIAHMAEGVPHEVRDSPRRQFAEQRRQPARHHGRPQLRLLRGVSRAAAPTSTRWWRISRWMTRGMSTRPEKPGLGYEIDWELVEREKTQVVR